MITNKITQGIQIGSNTELIQKAKEFMKINGYKLSYAGKCLACNDINDKIDDIEARIALQTAIMLIDEE